MKLEASYFIVSFFFADLIIKDEKLVYCKIILEIENQMW